MSRNSVKINNQIKAPSVRVVDSDSNFLGVLSIKDAISLAHEKSLDLIEISPNANPPVCKIMNFGKYQYEENKKKPKINNKKEKEIKININIEKHDLEIKVKHIKEYILDKNTVRFIIMLRNDRSNDKVLNGKNIINHIINELKNVAKPANPPKVEAKKISVIFQPSSH